MKLEWNVKQRIEDESNNNSNSTSIYVSIFRNILLLSK